MLRDWLRWTTYVLSIVLAANCGCRCGDCFGLRRGDDIAPGAIPQPIGTAACQWQVAQMELAELDDYVLYLREWQDKSANLDADAEHRLSALATCLMTVPYAIVIEPAPDEALNESRRQKVIELLAQLDVPEPASRVVIQRPIAEGMYGVSAPRIASGYLGSGNSGVQGTQSGSTIGGMGGSGFGGVGTGGFGGGGVF